MELPSGTNDQRIIGLISLIIVSIIPLISLDFEAKVFSYKILFKFNKKYGLSTVLESMDFIRISDTIISRLFCWSTNTS